MSQPFEIDESRDISVRDNKIAPEYAGITVHALHWACRMCGRQFLLDNPPRGARVRLNRGSPHQDEQRLRLIAEGLLMGVA